MKANRSRWLSALLFAGGCATGVDAAPDVGLTNQAFEVAYWVSNPTENVYSIVTDANLRICVEREPGTTLSQQTLEGYVADAVHQWVDAVQPKSSQPLFAGVDFTCERLVNDNTPLFDFWVILNPGLDRAWSHGEFMDLYEDEPALQQTVLHEMGHYFGLGDTYIEAGGGCKPNQPLAAVMCNSSSFRTLQTDDIQGAWQAFRIAHPDLYRGPRPVVAEGSNLCVDAAAFGTSNGTPVQLWGCDPGPLSNQVWTYSSNTQTYKVQHSGMCLDVAGGGSENGTQVWVWECNGAAWQQWENMSDGTIRSVANGKCLEVADFGTESGSALQIWDCHGGSNQQWHRI